MRKKLNPIEIKVLIFYAIALLLILALSIYVSVTIKMFEISGWNNFVLTKTLIVTLPLSALITLFITSKIVPPNNPETTNKKRQISLVSGFLLGTIINFIIIVALLQQTAKLYNVYGPNQKEVIVKGTVTKVYAKRKARKVRKRKNKITVQSVNLNKEIVFDSRKKFSVNDVFEEKLTLGSLGFLYKKFD